MRENRSLVKNLAHTAELINTLNGGMSQPSIRVQRESEEWVVRVRIPGVSMEQLKLEVKNSHLYLFQMLKSQNLGISLPYLIAVMPLIDQIDFEKISAEYHEGELLIVLPLSEQEDGFHREIEIVKK